MHSRGPGQAELLRRVREDPAALIADPKRDLRAFRVALTATAAAKRGRGRGSFIDSVLASIDTFYGDVLQHLKAWSASPPRLREPLEQLPTPPVLASNALSSQDGAETPTAPIAPPGPPHEPAESGVLAEET